MNKLCLTCDRKVGKGYTYCSKCSTKTCGICHKKYHSDGYVGNNPVCAQCRQDRQHSNYNKCGICHKQYESNGYTGTNPICISCRKAQDKQYVHCNKCGLRTKVNCMSCRETQNAQYKNCNECGIRINSDIPNDNNPICDSCKLFNLFKSKYGIGEMNSYELLNITHTMMNQLYDNNEMSDDGLLKIISIVFNEAFKSKNHRSQPPNIFLS